MKSNLAMSGNLGIQANLAKRASLKWRLTNTLKMRFLWNWFTFYLAKLFSKITGIPTATGRLHISHTDSDGQRTNYGWAAYGLVTDAFVEFMVDEMQADTGEFGDFKWHDSGIGVTAANVADTDIETTDNEARSAGTQVEGASAEIYRSVGTITYSGPLAITEHGLFSQNAGTTLLDRHVFAPVNVINGDSILFTYELTCNSGG